MTRKHFAALAAAMLGCKPKLDKEDAAYVQWTISVLAIADMCGGQNPRFDRVKFITACGYFS